MTRTRTVVLVALVAVAAVIAGVAAPIGAAAGAAQTPEAGHDAGTPVTAGDDAGVTATPSVAETAQSDELDCTYPRTFTDGGGTDVTIEEEPQEIVTLNPSAAQTLWEIGGEEKVVGVSAHASYLDGADERTSISGESGFTSTEKVVDLDPDLVLAPNTIQPETVTALRDNGLTVYHFPAATSIEDVYAKTERIGELTGECDGAAETVSWMKEEIAAVEENVDDGERPSVYMEFGGGWTTGANTFQHDALTAAGGANVAGEANITGWGELSDEVLIEQNPEYLVVLEGSGVPDREAIQASSAVRNDRIVEVDPNNMQQPAPRLVFAIQSINEQLYPSENGESSAGNETGDGEDGGDGTPGFGVVPAVCALLAVGFLTRRR